MPKKLRLIRRISFTYSWVTSVPSVGLSVSSSGALEVTTTVSFTRAGDTVKFEGGFLVDSEHYVGMLRGPETRSLNFDGIGGGPQTGKIVLPLVSGLSVTGNVGSRVGDGHGRSRNDSSSVIGDNAAKLRPVTDLCDRASRKTGDEPRQKAREKQSGRPHEIPPFDPENVRPTTDRC